MKKQCKFVERCPMYPKFQNKRVLRIYQIHFCESRFDTCARYQMATQGVVPPPTLLPDGESLPADNAA